jgi:LPS export ABC transporter protein LptC
MNINRTTAGIITAAILLVGSGLYYFFRPAPEPPPVPVVENTSAGDEIQYLGTGLSETKDGKLRWELNADQIQAGTDKKIVTLLGLRAKIYESAGQGNIQLTANEGRMEVENKVVTLQGNIKAVSEKGAELAGNMIKWFIKERRFTGEGNIQYFQKDVTVMGDNLEADLNLNVIRVTGNARAELRR